MIRTYTVKKAFTDRTGKKWEAGQAFVTSEETEATKEVLAGNVSEEASPHSRSTGRDKETEDGR